MSDLVEELLEKLEKAEAERDALAAQVTELEQLQRDMVAKATEKSLDGYRKLGQRAAKAEDERDALQAKLDRLWEAFTAITCGGYYLATELEDSISEIFADEDSRG